jgi:LacI family transcriptional regulator
MESKRIAVIMEGRVGYERNVLLGIRDFAHRQPDWIVRLEFPGRNIDRFLTDWNPDGVLFQSANLPASGIRALTSLRCPVIHVSDTRGSLGVPCVGLDNSAIGEMAATYLLDRGCANFGFVGLKEVGFSKLRQTAFTARLKHDGHTPKSFLLPGTVGTLDSEVERRLRRWLNHLPKPTAIFAVHDECSLRLVTLCRDEGIRVPEDVAILGSDNDELICELAGPKLSSIAVPARQVGALAAERLAAFLSRKTRRNRKATLLHPTGVIARQSTDVNRTEDATVNRVLRFIAAEFHRRLNVEDLLRETGVSRRALERLFHTHVGRSPLQELHRRRVEYACHLLKGGKDSLHVIAERCGFRDASQFVNVFRRQKGETPGRYRGGSIAGDEYRVVKRS